MMKCNNCNGIIYELGEYQYDDACTCNTDNIKSDRDYWKAEAEAKTIIISEYESVIKQYWADINAMTALAEKYQKERDELIIIIQRMIIHIHNSVIMKDLIFDANAVIKRIKEGRTDNDAIA